MGVNRLFYRWQTSLLTATGKGDELWAGRGEILLTGGFLSFS